MDAATKQKILKQCYSKRFDEKYSRKFQRKAIDVRNFVKLTPAGIIDLLNAASASARSQARLLLQLMQDGRGCRPRRCMKAGPGISPGDNNLHITLKVGDRSYHLQCKEQPRLHVIQITG
ncbi:hypothetical protein GN109_12430 [Collimonas pratensis]|uniref:hypothetical protein n=1 Tax=Collimonas pratensis TaxID=279113 RepID=UPI00143DEB26|nr:hypothetical protein [Collimonas pratensis]NKI70228.1 hypothetical protein [Collimonas pratensis]